MKTSLRVVYLYWGLLIGVKSNVTIPINIKYSSFIIQKLIPIIAQKEADNIKCIVFMFKV